MHICGQEIVKLVSWLVVVAHDIGPANNWLLQTVKEMMTNKLFLVESGAGFGAVLFYLNQHRQIFFLTQTHSHSASLHSGHLSTSVHPHTGKTEDVMCPHSSSALLTSALSHSVFKKQT